ncbi:MAG: glycosyltransferase [Asticcacaulis sp.]
MKSVSETFNSGGSHHEDESLTSHSECPAISARLLDLLPWGIGFFALIPTFVFSSYFSHNTIFAFIFSTFALLFFLGGSWRFIALSQTLDPTRFETVSRRNLPKYTVIVALYDEAHMVPQLLKALKALNYPREKLEIFLAVENHDHATNLVISTAKMPHHISRIVVNAGHPQTKPRALNAALYHATGRYVVVYDAEDLPHPDQLRAAAARFQQQPDLVCLQAPLIAKGQSWLARQFCAEYAALFQVLNPASTRLGLPFALGGTSNHLCRETLRLLGGWDSWNVTEDADLGLRLGRFGCKTAMLHGYPTYETAPERLAQWIPQRARWLKGFIQTLALHLNPVIWRRVKAKSADSRFWLSLTVSLTLPVISAALYAPASLLILARLFEALIRRTPPEIPLEAWGLLVWGWLSGSASIVMGLKRAGQPSPRLGDLLSLPVYWCLKTPAFALACWQLMFRPYHWNKTEHEPFIDLPTMIEAVRDPEHVTITQPRKQTGRRRKAAVSG